MKYECSNYEIGIGAKILSMLYFVVVLPLWIGEQS